MRIYRVKKVTDTKRDMPRDTFNHRIMLSSPLSWRNQSQSNLKYDGLLSPILR